MIAKKYMMTKGECIMKTTKTKETTKKKEARWEYWFCYVDRGNKFENALVDSKYEIDCREMAHQAFQDLRQLTNDNIRAVVTYKLLRKKFITVDE